MNDDGNIYVRIDNLTFSVSAYHGPKKPKPNLPIGNVKAMMEAAKKSAAEWQEKTAPQRKKDSIKLAKAVVANI